MTRKEDRLLKTKEVLETSGISRQVLYRYLQMGLLEPAATTDTGRNRFSSSIFRQIELIQSLNRSGYTLRDIRDIFAKRLRKMK
ncbi:MAG: MerR family transcriptional regulator [Planctomycetota bacterium]